MYTEFWKRTSQPNKPAYQNEEKQKKKIERTKEKRCKNLELKMIEIRWEIYKSHTHTHKPTFIHSFAYKTHKKYSISLRAIFRLHVRLYFFNFYIRSISITLHAAQILFSVLIRLFCTHTLLRFRECSFFLLLLVLLCAKKR